MSRLYRKRPVTVTAAQFRVSHPMGGWPEGVDLCQRGEDDCTGYGIQTLEKWVHVADGDMIITGVLGERYPCRQDVFARTYEPA